MHRVPLPRTTRQPKPTGMPCFLPVRLKSVRLTLLTCARNARAESVRFFWGHTKELANSLDFCLGKRKNLLHSFYQGS